MKIRYVPVTISVRSDLLDRVDAYVFGAGTNRSAFITELIAQRLAYKPVVSSTEAPAKEENHG